MSESLKTEAVHYTKEFENEEYGTHSDNNFVASQELTVTITLNEYRKLIEGKATSNVTLSKERDEKYRAQRAEAKLKEENAALKSKLFDLQDSGHQDQNEETEDDE